MSIAVSIWAEGASSRAASPLPKPRPAPESAADAPRSDDAGAAPANRPATSRAARNIRPAAAAVRTGISYTIPSDYWKVKVGAGSRPAMRPRPDAPRVKVAGGGRRAGQNALGRGQSWRQVAGTWAVGVQVS